ncbi:MAG TPA: Hpt domain-containing protein [Zeimonas sp.]
MTDAHRNESLEAADLAALSWCIGEIRESLAACERGLRGCLQPGEGDSDEAPGERAGLVAARSALHQAHGALAIVDLAGVTALTGEAEALLERVARGQLALDDAVLAALSRTFAALLEYLDELALGEPQQPLYLFPYYASLLQLRGAERIHPADLFVVPVRAQLVGNDDAMRERDAAELVAARVSFERGLLSVLRDPLDSEGLAALHASVATIGASQVGAAHPTFWKVALAYFEALRDGALALDVYGKRLLARLNLQLRRSIADGALVADRLLKDTLFALAGADEARSAGSPLLAEVRRAFGLAGSVPPDYATPRFGRIDAQAVQASREAIARAKLGWEKLSSGSAAELAAFTQSIAALRGAAAKLPFPGVRALADAFGEASRVLALGKAVPSDSLALEVASALLFAEQIFERGLKGRGDHDARAGEMAERVLQCCAGRPPADDMPGWLGDISRAAQERLTMSTFIAEAQDNLRSAEQTLDAFFRDASQRADLAPIAQRLRQVAGALGLLGHEEAAAAARAAAARVDEFASAEGIPAPEVCQNVADSIGALGFFVERLQQANRSGARFAFDAASGRFDAVLDEARPDPRTALVALDATAESLLAQHTRQALELVATLAEHPRDAATRDALRRTLAKVRDDAHFADDAALKAHASESIACLDRSTGEDVSELRVAVAKLAGEPQAAPVEPAAAEPERSDDEVDRELLEIFLGEAREVLAAIADASSGSRSAPRDTALLTTIRRGFHTLKGSSRMVGLAAFGDAAWAMEQVLNLWLAEERAATEALHALIDAAHLRFVRWVDALNADASLSIDPAPIVAAATALREGREAEAVLPPAREASSPRPETRATDGEPVEAAGLDAPSVEPGPLEAEVLEVATLEAETLEAETLEAESLDADTPEAEWLDAETPQTETLDAVAADVGELTDTAEALGAGEAYDAVEAPQPDDVVIGERSISRPLYEIFLSEADELVATLSTDAADWAVQPERVATEAAQRAMHSLKGSAALVQLDEVHAIAEQLETFLLRQRAQARAVAAGDLDDYAQAIERMRAMLHQFAAGHTPRPEPDAFALAHALAARWDPRAAPAQAAVASVVSGEDLDADLLPIFVEEASDQLPRIGENLRQWQSAPDDRSLPQQLMRDLHTVKGSARMAGAMVLGQRVHEMETRIEAASVLTVVPAALIDELIADHDAVVGLFEAIRDPGLRVPDTVRTSPAEALVDAVDASPAQVAAVETADRMQPTHERIADPEPDASMHPAAVPQEPSVSPPVRSSSDLRAAGPATVSSTGTSLVRVRADLLERAVNESGEVSIARLRIENELGTLRQVLQDLTENVARLRSQLREVEIQAESQVQARIAQQKETTAEFDPLEFDRYTRFQELTRMLAESVNDVATVQTNAMRSLDDASHDMLRHAQVLRDLQQNLMRMRMVQFGTISDRLYRVVRQAAKDAGKRVSMDLRGASVEIDRGVLERMVGPIEHLLRNAVAHGIESAGERQAAAKAETGEIRVEVRQEGNEVVLVFSDDGRGLDYAKILARARAIGLVDAGAQPSERDLAEMIFAPGFSTASEVTELSGRGVGTDVVRAEVQSLGGRIDIDSRAGHGTRFTVHLPLTLAIAQVVVVTVGPTRYAIPSSSVEQVLQLKPQALAAAYDEGSVEWQGARVPMHYLGALVGLDDQHALAQHLSPVVVVRSGALRLAMHVDAVSRNQEVVVKNVGAQVARVPGVGGATVLGDGEIVLILNAARLAQQVLGDLWLEQRSAAVDRRALAEAPPTVMVVDDSLTVRKVTQRLLVREGYEVMLAKDGVDAMRQLQNRQPDVMLVDIEMPRMDGFDLTRNIRADDRLRDTPIVMITSRMADKHRNHAMSLGVDVYLGKPYRDDELLGHIARFVEERLQTSNAGPSLTEVPFARL